MGRPFIVYLLLVSSTHNTVSHNFMVRWTNLEIVFCIFMSSLKHTTDSMKHNWKYIISDSSSNSLKFSSIFLDSLYNVVAKNFSCHGRISINYWGFCKTTCTLHGVPLQSTSNYTNNMINNISCWWHPLILALILLSFWYSTFFVNCTLTFVTPKYWWMNSSNEIHCNSNLLSTYRKGFIKVTCVNLV